MISVVSLEAVELQQTPELASSSGVEDQAIIRITDESITVLLDANLVDLYLQRLEELEPPVGLEDLLLERLGSEDSNLLDLDVRSPECPEVPCSLLLAPLLLQVVEGQPVLLQDSHGVVPPVVEADASPSLEEEVISLLKSVLLELLAFGVGLELQPELENEVALTPLHSEVRDVLRRGEATEVRVQLVPLMEVDPSGLGSALVGNALRDACHQVLLNLVVQ